MPCGDQHLRQCAHGAGHGGGGRRRVAGLRIGQDSDAPRRGARRPGGAVSAAVLDAICTEPAGYVRAIRGGCALCDTRQKRAKAHALRALFACTASPATTLAAAFCDLTRLCASAYMKRIMRSALRVECSRCPFSCIHLCKK